LNKRQFLTQVLLALAKLVTAEGIELRSRSDKVRLLTAELLASAIFRCFST